ncbi:MAG: hypothetical protein HY901_30550 [Deltaproteobacteria bacterium]|nr:hypothetical protein [Deltaproteobacteria bacterium]
MKRNTVATMAAAGVLAVFCGKAGAEESSKGSVVAGYGQDFSCRFATRLVSYSFSAPKDAPWLCGRGIDATGEPSDTNSHHLLNLLLSRKPPTRLTVTLTSARGESREIVWDPLVDEKLVKQVILPPGLWVIGVSSVPLRNPMDQHWKDLSWQLAAQEVGSKRWQCNYAHATDEVCGLVGEKESKSSFGAFSLKLKSDANDSAATLSLWPTRLRSPSKALEALATSHGGAAGGRDLNGRRSLLGGGFEQAAEQTVQIVAEAIAEFVSDKVSQKVSEMLSEWLDLLKPLQFPRTKAVLKGVGPSHALAVVAKELARAVLADGVTNAFALAAPPETTSHRRLLLGLDASLSDILTGTILGSAEADDRLAVARWARLLRDELQGSPVYPTNSDGPVDGLTVLGTVVALAAQCYAEAGCDARALQDRLVAADRFLLVNNWARLRSTIKAWRGAGTLAENLQRAVEDATPPAERALATVSMLLESRRVLLCPSSELTAFQVCLEGAPPIALPEPLREKVVEALSEKAETISAEMASITSLVKSLDYARDAERASQDAENSLKAVGSVDADLLARSTRAKEQAGNALRTASQAFAEQAERILLAHAKASITSSQGLTFAADLEKRLQSRDGLDVPGIEGLLKPSATQNLAVKVTLSGVTLAEKQIELRKATQQAVESAASVQHRLNVLRAKLAGPIEADRQQVLLTSFAQGVAKRSWSEAIVGLGAMVAGPGSQESPFFAVIGAVAAMLDSAPGDEQKAKDTAKAAIKTALSVATANQRARNLGAYKGLYVALRFQPSFGILHTEQFADKMAIAPSIPIGIGGDVRLDRYLGVRGEAAVFDVGRALAWQADHSEPDLGPILSWSAGLGLVFGAELDWSVLIHAGYSPLERDNHGRAWWALSFGKNISLYDL